MRPALTTVSSAASRVTNDDDSTAAGKSMSIDNSSTWSAPRATKGIGRKLTRPLRRALKARRTVDRDAGSAKR